MDLTEAPSTTSPTLTGSAANTLPGAIRCKPSTRISATTNGSICAVALGTAMVDITPKMKTERSLVNQLLLNLRTILFAYYPDKSLISVVFDFVSVAKAQEYLTVEPHRCRWQTP